MVLDKVCVVLKQSCLLESIRTIRESRTDTGAVATWSNNLRTQGSREGLLKSLVKKRTIDQDGKDCRGPEALLSPVPPQGQDNKELTSLW